jgi:uncharacterized protein (DUF58 family)
MKWYLGAALLLLVALVFQLGLLAYAMYVLLALLISSRVLARNWIESLSATRECNRLSAEIGESIAVVVTVTNNGRAGALGAARRPAAAAGACATAAAITHERSEDGDRHALGRRKKVALLPTALRYAGLCPDRPAGDGGRRPVRPAPVRVAAEPHFILVYPRVVPLVGFDIASRRPIGETRLTHRLFEDPTRIAGVRLFQSGDPLNRVNWRATARTGTLHSKVYEPSCITGATVVLDFHQRGYLARHEPVGSELAVTAAASLANAVYEMGQQIGLVTNGRDAVDRIRSEGWEGDFRTRDIARQAAAMSEQSDRLAPLIVPTRRGPEQLRRILETLARVELTDGLTFAELVSEAAPRLPNDATVIAVLADVPLETAWALGNLRRRGRAVTAVLIGFDPDQAADCYGRLLAEGIDVRHLKSVDHLPALCQQQLLR